MRTTRRHALIGHLGIGLALGCTSVLGLGSTERAAAAPVPGTDVTYSLDVNFDLGTLLNVNHDAPNSDQLQINDQITPFPFVNVAASARGTIIRIDANTGAILGEYRTAPDGMGRDPSRTTVDQNGNVWVSNRAEGGVSGGQPKGSVARVGLLVGGTRADADGTANPIGQYVKPPFDYNTCVDRDGDGLLKTSRALGNILPWTNAGGVDTHGGVSTAEDECLINYTRVVGTNTRTVAVDANNDVWVGGLGDLDHEKLDGVTGLPVAGTQFNFGCGGYGGLVDGNGVLWSARGGTGLLRYDTIVPPGPPPSCRGNSTGDYGLGVDPMTGEIWHTFLGGNRVARLAPGGALIAIYPHGSEFAQGVAVDGNGNVWVAHSLLGGFMTVGHLRTDGTFVGNVTLPGGSGPTGVAVDANGKVWVTNYFSDNAMRIDPSAGPVGGGGFSVGAVDLTVDLGAGASPYNYSDMTGFLSIGATTGTWTVVQDSGVPGNAWGLVTWNTEPQGSEPAGTSITVEVRTSDSEAGLSGEVFVPVGNGAPFALAGRFIEVQVTLKKDTVAGVSPVLSDIQIQSARPSCNGQSATVYVKDGIIVGGPDNGLLYTGYLRGTPGNDVIVGTDGPDLIKGFDGDDIICGGDGGDRIEGGAGNDWIDGGAGDDLIKGQFGNDTLYGGDDNDRIEAGPGDDDLDGGPGTNILNGETGTDTCVNGPTFISC